MAKSTNASNRRTVEMEVLLPSHELLIGPQVEVTYQLTKSADLKVFEIEFGELYEPADLDEDFVSPTSYRRKSTLPPYKAFLSDDRKLKVRVMVSGIKGHSWSMTVQVNNSNIPAPQPKRTLPESGFDVYEKHHSI